jgi:tetratricopeptide (TPR) repeat protein
MSQLSGANTSPFPPATQFGSEEILGALERGGVDDALRMCEDAIAAQPASAALMWLMGRIRHRLGQLESAAEWLGKAIDADERQAAYHHALGNVLHDQRKLDRAIGCYRRALRLEPRLAGAHNDLGTAYFDKGFLEEAASALRQAIALDPEHLAAYENLGVVLRSRGRWNEARKVFQAVLRRRASRGLRRWLPFRARVNARETPAGASRSPDSASPERVLPEVERLRQAGALGKAQELAEQLVNSDPGNLEAVLALAQLYEQARNYSAALEFYSRADALRPGMFAVQYGIGKAYAGLSNPGYAARHLRAAASLDNDSADVHAQLGAALSDLERRDEAAAAFQQAIRLDPGNAAHRLRLANTLFRLGRVDDAVAAARAALEIEPGSAEVLNDAAAVLMNSGQSVPEAAELFTRALPDSATPAIVHTNLGWAAQHMGDFAAAEKQYLRALRIEPGNAQANFNLCTLDLLQGRYERGFDRYFWRKLFPGRGGNYPRLPGQLWDGSPLETRSIFVHGEQAIGDEIMFASCFPELVAQAGRCVIGCSPRLEKLFRRSFSKAEVIVDADDRPTRWIGIAPRTDFYAPSGDLPYFLRRGAGAFPDHGGYLKADPERTAHWRSLLDRVDGNAKVGVAWRGGTKYTGRLRRSLELEQLLPVLSLPGLAFVSVQYGKVDDELNAFRSRHQADFHHFDAALKDLDELAALISALDITISVCSSTVHLAGALGRQAWVLTPFVPEWRYGAHGRTMPWYSSARMFRQPRLGAWQDVIERVRGELQSFAASCAGRIA